MRRVALSFGALLLAAPLAAQSGVPWRSNYFPYVMGNPATGAMLVAHFDHSRQADYDARVVYDGSFAVDGGISAQGSRFLAARFRAPALVPGWRFALDAGALRESRFGYDSDGALTPDDGNVNRVHRARYLVRGEVTRAITGPLALSAMIGVEHARWSRLPGETAFRTDYGDELAQTDAGGRVSLVLDLRDREFLTTKGLLAEAGLLFGGGGEDRDGDVISRGAYAGWYAHLRGYASPRSGTLVAGRLAARLVDRVAPLSARTTLPGWEDGVDALGGAYAHRSLIPGRLSGRGLLLGSVEVRHNLLDVGDYGAVTLIAFADGGRVFRDEPFTLTTRGWKVGGGAGLGLRVLRSALLTFNFAGGPDGFVFSMGNAWAF